MTVGEGDVLGRYAHPLDAAEAIVNSGAPCSQIVCVNEDGEPEWLDDLEEQAVRDYCHARGYSLDEVER